MNIGIITVYESIDNYGSYLQAYALKRYLEQLGHTVFLLKNRSTAAALKQYLFKIDPKREFFLRFKKAAVFLTDTARLNVMDKESAHGRSLDLLIYGSDEIWNLENPAFRAPFFWGDGYGDVPKLAYAVSVGSMERDTEEAHAPLFCDLDRFLRIMVRDERTCDFVRRRTGVSPAIVCDPTMLLPADSLFEPIRRPKRPYLFVYTYGVDEHIADLIRRYAHDRGLLIVSACFWHPWADKTVECSPLQLSALMRGADSVFTSTFHGAVFALMNHTKCCIYPNREKVRDVVRRLGMEDRLMDADCSYEGFARTMQSEFRTEAFEEKLASWRSFSKNELEGSLRCLTR